MGKTKSKREVNNKRIIRSSLTGRVINGREVILVSEAEDYLKQNGFIIVDEKEVINYLK